MVELIFTKVLTNPGSSLLTKLVVPRPDEAKKLFGWGHEMAIGTHLDRAPTRLNNYSFRYSCVE